jgi:hypothetical protein
MNIDDKIHPHELIEEVLAEIHASDINLYGKHPQKRGDVILTAFNQV